jgi:hypothetical protein
MERRPLPAVRDLTRAGRWSTYDVSVLKLYSVSFPGRCARMGVGHTLKILHQQNSHGWFIFLQLARQGALPARCSMYMSFLWNQPKKDPFYMYS